MVDAYVSGAYVERRAGSSPVLGTGSNWFWRDGGIGRRATLRGWCPFGCGSSNLLMRTKPNRSSVRLF